MVRIIAASKNPIAHTDPLFANLAILKIGDLYTQRVRTFSFKLCRGLLPSGVLSLFGRVSHTHKTRGASGGLFVGRYSERSIKTMALKKSPSIGSFRDHSTRSLLAPYAEFVCSVRSCPSCLGGPAP